MTFEVDCMHFIQPLDPYQGLRFIELVDDVEFSILVDLLYQLIVGK